MHPMLAARSCDLCKKIMFDEETGTPIKARSGEGFAKRIGKVPCESTIGCKKGHWKDAPDLNAPQQGVIDLFHASMASGGACLSEDERSDWWLMQTFGKLRSLEESVKRQNLEMLSSRLAFGG
jgi:hypothetical protein